MQVEKEETQAGRYHVIDQVEGGTCMGAYIGRREKRGKREKEIPTSVLCFRMIGRELHDCERRREMSEASSFPREVLQSLKKERNKGERGSPYETYLVVYK